MMGVGSGFLWQTTTVKLTVALAITKRKNRDPQPILSVMHVKCTNLRVTRTDRSLFETWSELESPKRHVNIGKY